MVNLRINWTLYTGEVRNLEETPQQKPYRGRGKCLFIFQVYHSLRIHGHKLESLCYKREEKAQETVLRVRGAGTRPAPTKYAKKLVRLETAPTSFGPGRHGF